MESKNKINIQLIILVLILSPLLAKSQEIDEEQKSLVIRNIMSYHFRYAQQFELNLLNDNVFEGSSPFFERMWPSTLNTLELEVENSSIHYPSNKYRVYHIIKRGFTFSKDSTTTTYTNISLSFDRDYFVAINIENRRVKFISGNFFLSPIASDFPLDVTKPESFFNFLKIRYLNLGVADLKYHGQHNENLIYHAYSKLAKAKIVLTVDESNFDNTQWKFSSKIKPIQ